MPETNIPGVPVGGAALLPSIQFASASVTPFVVRAAGVDTDISTNPQAFTCDRLICPTGGADPLAPCLDPGTDYFQLPAFNVPSGDSTVVLAIEGCLPGASVAECGSTYDGGMNLFAAVGPLSSSPDDGGLTLQIAQLSPSFNQATSNQGSPLTYLDPTIDASVSLAASSGFPLLSPVTVPLSEAGVLSAYFVIAQSGAPVTQSLASIQYFQAPASDPDTYFNAPSAYFAAIVGDATDAAAPLNLPDGAPNSYFDGRGLHVIVYPEQGN